MPTNLRTPKLLPLPSDGRVFSRDRRLFSVVSSCSARSPSRIRWYLSLTILISYQRRFCASFRRFNIKPSVLRSSLIANVSSLIGECSCLSARFPTLSRKEQCPNESLQTLSDKEQCLSESVQTLRKFLQCALKTVQSGIKILQCDLKVVHSGFKMIQCGVKTLQSDICAVQ